MIQRVVLHALVNHLAVHQEHLPAPRRGDANAFAAHAEDVDEIRHAHQLGEGVAVAVDAAFARGYGEGAVALERAEEGEVEVTVGRVRGPDNIAADSEHREHREGDAHERR